MAAKKTKVVKPIEKKKTTKKNVGGRPAKYEFWLEPDNLEKVRNWRRNGATLKDLSGLMHVGEGTIKEWGKRFPDFKSALKEAEVYDDIAEETLHKLGIEGWITQEITEELKTDPVTGEQKLVVTKRVTKQNPPNATALIFWLKCRRPDIWREKKYEDIAVDTAIQVEMPESVDEYAD